MKVEFRQNADQHLSLITKFKKDFRIRRSPNYTEIEMTHGKQRIIFNENNDFKKGLFLFNMVRKDVNKFLEQSTVEIELDELPVNKTNIKFDKSNQVIAIDLNHAYWRIAYLKDYISENTYFKGLEDDMPKSLKLATLSTLGRPKTYDVYVKGEYSHSENTEANNELMNLYNDIRQSTYRIMQEIADALGGDFFCWRTDCIYFKNTEENCQTVINIVESHNIGWKYATKEY